MHLSVILVHVSKHVVIILEGVRSALQLLPHSAVMSISPASISALAASVILLKSSSA